LAYLIRERREFLNGCFVKRCFEGDDQIGQSFELNPFPCTEFGFCGVDVNVRVLAVKLKRQKLDPLSAIPTGPTDFGDAAGQVVGDPARRLGPERDGGCSNFFQQFAVGGGSGILAVVDATLGELPGWFFNVVALGDQH